MKLESQIEAVLFYKAEPVSRAYLAKALKTEEAEIEAAIKNLGAELTGRGLVLMEESGEYVLGTAPEASSLIEELTREELTRDLGKAGLETLTIILYQGPVSRAEIDYIRGVNSSFILRHLSVRGLIEKKPKPNDARSFVYSPSLELLSHLGIKELEELPEREKIKTDIEAILQEVKTEPMAS